MSEDDDAILKSYNCPKFPTNEEMDNVVKLLEVLKTTYNIVHPLDEVHKKHEER